MFWVSAGGAALPVAVIWFVTRPSQRRLMEAVVGAAAAGILVGLPAVAVTAT